MTSSIIWWNYLLAAIDIVGLVALIAVGRKRAVGWLWAMITQAVWIVYSTATLQWGFLAVAVVKLAIYSWNWATWSRKVTRTRTAEHLAAEIVDNQYSTASDEDRRVLVEDLLATLYREGFYDKPPKQVSV
ncbi:hypothetical protein ACWGQT_00220 [Streptomyces yangpuensis]